MRLSTRIDHTDEEDRLHKGNIISDKNNQKEMTVFLDAAI
jgi:hypothetical protein